MEIKERNGYIIMDSIIKNRIDVFGDYEGTNQIVKKIKDEKGKFSFDRIIPMEQIRDDDEMNDYICACINLYMINNNINDEKFINTCKFVGITRKNPYNFQILDNDKINEYKKKYKTKKMMSDAEFFLDKIRSRIIFNGTIMRDVKWGTISGPSNLKVKNNIFEFDTFYTPPSKVIHELFQLVLSNPRVSISYICVSGEKVNNILLSNGKIEYKVKTELDNVNIKDVIKRNVFI